MLLILNGLKRDISKMHVMLNLFQHLIPTCLRFFAKPVVNVFERLRMTNTRQLAMLKPYFIWKKVQVQKPLLSLSCCVGFQSRRLESGWSIRPMLANERLSVWKAFFVCETDRSNKFRCRAESFLNGLSRNETSRLKFILSARLRQAGSRKAQDDNRISQSSLCSSFRND